jgi:hypothetical protein
MSLPTCTPCPPLVCCDSNPFAYSITDGQVIRSQQVSVVFDCPPGFVCTPGSYPRTITIPAGEFKIPVPMPNPDGEPFPLRLSCCQSQLVRYAPANATQAQLNAIALEMVNECAQQQAACINESGPGDTASRRYANTPQHASCPDDHTLIAITPLTGPFTISGSDLILKAGVFTGITQDAANAAALAYVTEALATGISRGTLSCDTDWSITGVCGNVYDFTQPPNTHPPSGLVIAGNTGSLHPVGCSDRLRDNSEEGCCGPVGAEAACSEFFGFQFTASRTYGPFTMSKVIRLQGSISDSVHAFTCPANNPIPVCGGFTAQNVPRYLAHTLSVRCGTHLITTSLGGGNFCAPLNPIAATVPFNLAQPLLPTQTALVQISRAYDGGSLTGSFTVTVEDA